MPWCGLFQQETHLYNGVVIHRTRHLVTLVSYICGVMSCGLIVFLFYLQERLCRSHVKVIWRKEHACPVNTDRRTPSIQMG